MAFAAMAPIIAAGIGAAGSIAGGMLSRSGNQGAAGMSTQAAQEAARMAQTAGNTSLTQAGEQSGQDRSALTPWTQTGGAAGDIIGQLLGLGRLRSSGDANGTMYLDPSNWQQNQRDAISRFQTDPGYQFRLQQGVNALSNSAAARGGTFSGAQAKALSDYGQNTGSAEYANWFNRLAGASGQGLVAQNAANTASNQIMNTGINNAFQGGVQGAADLLGGANNAAGYGVAGNNAMASGLLGGGNSLASGLMNAFAGPGTGSIFGGGASNFIPPNLSGFAQGGGPQGPSGGALA